MTAHLTRRRTRRVLIGVLASLGMLFSFTGTALADGGHPTYLDGPDRAGAAAAAAYFGDCTHDTYVSCNIVHRGEGANYGNYFFDFSNELFGSDCTNFVSNSLRVGGGLEREPNSMKTPRTDPNSWYSVYTNFHGDDHGVDSVRRTYTWAAVTNFFNYWSVTRHDVWLSHDNPSFNTNSADLGDVIVYDFGLSSKVNYDHTTVETGYGTSKTERGYYGDLISQHSPGRTNHSWNYAYTSDHARLDRQRMIQRGFIVMHWKYGFDGWFDYSDGGGGGGPVAT